jgi:hypothetical protein
LVTGYLSGFEDDHVFIKRLEQGVGESCLSVEKASAQEVEQQKLDDGTSRDAVEELLLVEAALVEVWGEECLAEAEGTMSGAIFEDLEGFEGAVGVVAVEPVADSFAEREVVKVTGELADRAVRNGDGIDETLVAHLFGTEEPEVKGRGLDVLEPCVEKEVAAANAEGNGVGGRLDGALEAGYKLGSGTLIGVEIEDPLMAERDIEESPILVRGPVVKDTLGDDGSGLAGDFYSSVGAERVEDVDVV